MYIYTILHVANQARGLARHTHKLLVYHTFFTLLQMTAIYTEVLQKLQSRHVALHTLQ